MTVRILVALPLIALTLIALFLKNPVFLSGFVALVSVLMAFELAGLFERIGLRVSKPWLIGVAVLPLGVYLWLGRMPVSWGGGGVMSLPLFVVFLFALASFGVQSLSDGDFKVRLFSSIADVFLAFYLFMFGFSVIFLKVVGGPWLLLFVGVIAWLTDTFALVVGKVAGKHKLSFSSSPNKTVEGCLGGWIGGAISGVVVWQGFYRHFALPDWFAILMILALPVVSEIGDFAESLIKRTAGEKDSSSLFPGHGGILDIVDSFSFSAIFFTLSIVFLSWLQI